MLDRQKLETLLANRFPGATPTQIAAAANAIVAMMGSAGDSADGDITARNAPRRDADLRFPRPPPTR